MRLKIAICNLLVSIFYVVFLLNLSNSAIAGKDTAKKNVFDIHTKIVVDKKLISNPHIITNENEKAAIIVTKEHDPETLNLELTAKNVDHSKDAILIKFNIHYKNNKEAIHSNKKIILVSNQEGKVKIASKSGHVYEMYIIAKKQ